MKRVAFVPIRLNSQRVVGKNLRELGGRPLLTHILDALAAAENIDEVYVYCSSPAIREYLPEGVKFLQRDTRLDSNETLGAEIYDAFTSEVDADIYILAHTTSPFIRTATIEEALRKVECEGYDSAFSAKKEQSFAWYEGQPLNYSLSHIPRTQDLEAVYVETSAFFIFRRDVWREQHRRIGDKPYIAVTDRIESIDIDNPDDFLLAEAIAKAGLNK
jgi:CMP-N-acetylneuraminic acid synthetase